MSKGLGRGLGSLIPQKINKAVSSVSGEAVVDVSSQADKDRITEVDLNKIHVNPLQPRKRFADREMDELAESIRQYGIIQPLVVSEKDGECELIAGERRLRAAKIAGLDKVPVIFRDSGTQERLEIALIENLQRENLNPVETALAFRKLIDEFNLTQEEVAKKVGRSRSGVANTLRTLNLPEDIQLALIEGRIFEGHAKLLAGLDSEVKQMALFRKIINHSLPLESVIKEARRMGGTKAARIKINYADKDKEFAFREFFGTKVEIKRRGRGGQVILEFYSDEELESMVGKIRK